MFDINDHKAKTKKGKKKRKKSIWMRHYAWIENKTMQYNMQESQGQLKNM